MIEWLTEIGQKIQAEDALFETLCLLGVLILTLLTLRSTRKSKEHLKEAKDNFQRVDDIRSGKLTPHLDVTINKDGSRTESGYFK